MRIKKYVLLFIILILTGNVYAKPYYWFTNAGAADTPEGACAIIGPEVKPVYPLRDSPPQAPAQNWGHYGICSNGALLFLWEGWCPEHHIYVNEDRI